MSARNNDGSSTGAEPIVRLISDTSQWRADSPGLRAAYRSRGENRDRRRRRRRNCYIAQPLRRALATMASGNGLCH